MASSCCWLPPILLLLGVSGAGMTQALEAYRYPFMVVTFGFLGFAFYLTYRPRSHGSTSANGGNDCCAETVTTDGVAVPKRRHFNMMAMNKVMLWGVTAMAVVFLFFPQFITDLLASGETEVTVDMNRAVMTVEGMTCEG